MSPEVVSVEQYSVGHCLRYKMASDGINEAPRTDVELASVPFHKEIDPYLVAFDESFDSDNPK